MQQVIRALGWATKLLWIMLVVIIITIAYSATQINVAFGEATTTATEEAIAISMPISIHNAGLYDLTHLNITTFITDQNSQTLARGATVTPLIQKGTSDTRTHTITINVTQLLSQDDNFLFNDTIFTVFQYVGFNYANAIPLSVHANYTMPWGALLSNLAVRQITYQSYNSTHSTVNVQIVFENHNQYVPVTGTMRIRVYNNQHVRMGGVTVNGDVQPNSPGNVQASMLVDNSRITPTGEVRLYFTTSVFSYGPVVKPYNATSGVVP